MTPDAEAILASLQQVADERAAQAREPALGARVAAVKAYQQQRFRRDYAQYLDSPRYGPAAAFFLDELYGPRDFSERDAQFERVVPALARLFPDTIVHTVSVLARLHALSESLDGEMARQLPAMPPDADSYIRAWQATGRAEQRELQIRLTVDVGAALDRYTGNPLLRNSLRLMRGPARAAGLSNLQAFLERGFDAFRAMRGASGFLQGIAQCERATASALFGCTPGSEAWRALAARLP